MGQRISKLRERLAIMVPIRTIDQAYNDLITVPVSLGNGKTEATSMRELQYDTISFADFQYYLHLYGDHVRDVYQHVEEERFTNIPERLQIRTPKHIERQEVIDLDRWVQKRGPQLNIADHKQNQTLIESNKDVEIIQFTKEALEKYPGGNLFEAMKILERLHGVDPSRASLLLSVAYPDAVPFLSEELRRWVLPKEPIGRSTRRYRKKCFDRVELMKSNMSVTAVDVEKVAFVLDCEGNVSDGSWAFLHKYTLPGQGIVAVKRTPKIPKIKRHRLFAEILDSARVSEESQELFVRFFGWNEDDANYYFAMEYIELGDLQQMIVRNHKARSWKEADYKTITRQLACGLSIMHKAGITHRDLKPKNILVVSEHPDKLQVKLADFGISKRCSDRGTTNLRTEKGTVQYMAPEIKERWAAEVDEERSRVPSISYTEKVDIWSLGCVVYKMVINKDIFVLGPPPTSEDRDEVNDILERMELNESGVRFVKELLSFEALDRPCAETVLKMDWLAGS